MFGPVIMLNQELPCSGATLQGPRQGQSKGPVPQARPPPKSGPQHGLPNSGAQTGEQGTCLLHHTVIGNEVHALLHLQAWVPAAAQHNLPRCTRATQSRWSAWASHNHPAFTQPAGVGRHSASQRKLFERQGQQLAGRSQRFTQRTIRGQHGGAGVGQGCRCRHLSKACQPGGNGQEGWQAMRGGSRQFRLHIHATRQVGWRQWFAHWHPSHSHIQLRQGRAHWQELSACKCKEVQPTQWMLTHTSSSARVALTARHTGANVPATLTTCRGAKRQEGMHETQLQMLMQKPAAGPIGPCPQPNTPGPAAPSVAPRTTPTDAAGAAPPSSWACSAMHGGQAGPSNGSATRQGRAGWTGFVWNVPAQP